VPSFGEKLKKEREKRKITLEEISSSTKIGTRMLQALEEDKFNQLPGGIFNKGFVRAYARSIGIDEDQTVAEYLQASGDAPPPSTEVAREWEERGAGGHGKADAKAQRDARPESVSENPSRPLPWGLFAAILLLVALALSLWSRHTRDEARQSAPKAAASTTRPPSDTGAAAESTGTSSEGAPSGGTSAETTTGAGLAADASKVPGRSAAVGTARPPDRTSVGTPAQKPAGEQAVSPSTTSIPSSSTPSSQTPASGSAISSTPASTPAAGEFSVVVQTREESWISMRADGKTVPSELLPAGSEREVRARREVVVKIGNAGAVDLRFNGKKVDGGGDFGEVRLVTFGPNGLLPNAPAAPSNP
jgi:cytoskeleton protein RodZ